MFVRFLRTRKRVRSFFVLDREPIRINIRGAYETRRVPSRDALPANSRRTKCEGEPLRMARIVYLRRSATQIRGVRISRSDVKRERARVRARSLLVEHRGFEPLTPTLPVLCAPNCANAPLFLLLELVIRLELTTCWLRISCTTDCATPASRQRKYYNESFPICQYFFEKNCFFTFRSEKTLTNSSFML